MSGNSNQENDQQSKNCGEDSNAGNNDNKGLSFKDWKSMKVGSGSKSNEKPKSKKIASTKDTKKKTGSDLKGNRRFQDDYDRYGDLGRNGTNYLAGNMLASCFMPPDNFNNFNGNMNNFNNNCDMRGNNNFGYQNNGFGNNNSFNRQNNIGGNNFNNGFNNFNGPNNFNRPNNFGNNVGGNNFSCNFNMRGNNNFASSNNSSNASFNNKNKFGGNKMNVSNNFSNNSNNLNGTNNLPLPDNFFASDGIFRQKDFMQKPLANPFRNDEKAKWLLDDFDNARYTNDKKKKKSKNKAIKGTVSQQQESGNASEQTREPEVFIKNPKAGKDGKAFIPKPNRPEENLEITKDEKKQQWKEYREAMKPFKNREFYNAKRVVQRLGKKPLSELEEKEIIRLQNAHEIMAVHKARLTEKYGKYERAASETSELGELYLLKKKTLTGSDYGCRPTNKPYQNSANFGDNGENNDFESGRKILGGYSGFISGGMLEGATQKLANE